MSAKRKIAALLESDLDARTPKRQKLPMDAIDASEETAETTTASGLKFIESLKNSKDKTGRPIAVEFMSLPDPHSFPNYYEEIKMPIAIETMEAKLRRYEYPTLTSLEGDLKRMIANAKQFNDRQSEIFEDAERVRKSAVNFFTRYNPAYRDATYQAAPTPLPGDGPVVPIPGRLRIKASLPDPTPSRSSQMTPASASPAPTQAPNKTSSHGQTDVSGSKGDSSDFIGKTYLQAQDKIIDELLNYTEDDVAIFTPFANLPARSLVDYYQVIKKPTSLKGMAKRVRGRHGREEPTWISDFQTWDAFEEEMSNIWKNAQQYNEDGSSIYELADEFREIFQRRLADAKAVVEQPPQPKLKLNMSAAPPVPSIKLKFGTGAAGHVKSPGESSNTASAKAATGVIVDNEALARQRDLVNASIPTPVPAPASTQPTPAAANPTSIQINNGTSTPLTSSLTNGDKAELPNGHSNSNPGSGAAIQPNSTSSQSTAVRPPSNSLYTSHYQGGGHYHGPTSHGGPLQSLMENKIRPIGRTAAESILPKLTIASPPGFSLHSPFSLTIPASDLLTQQSVTVTLPGTHSYLQIRPYIPPSVTSRPYRIFVLANGQKQTMPNLSGVPKDKNKPMYEARLERGAVNRIEVEVLAVRERKSTSAVHGEDGGINGVGEDKREEAEFEKCTVYAHVMNF